MRQFTVLAFLAVASVPAWADEVVLRNGARFEGDVRVSKDTVTVVMDFGSITFKKIDVARIERGPSPILVFDGRLVLVKPDDLEGRYELAMWGLEHGLDQRATRLLEGILARNPDHAKAREALGYRRHDGRWVTEEEYHREKGLVPFRGEWMKREIVEEIARIEAEKEAEIQRQVNLEMLRYRVEQAEAAAARAQEEAAAARAQAEANARYEESYATTFFYRWYGAPPGYACAPQRPLFLGNATFLPGRCPPTTCAPARCATPTKGPAPVLAGGKK